MICTLHVLLPFWGAESWKAAFEDVQNVSTCFHQVAFFQDKNQYTDSAGWVMALVGEALCRAIEAREAEAYGMAWSQPEWNKKQGVNQLRSFELGQDYYLNLVGKRKCFKSFTSNLDSQMDDRMWSHFFI